MTNRKLKAKKLKNIGFWVTTERSESGPYYAGVTACYLLVNKSIRRGYKSMPEHVNMMDKSMKHKIIIDHIGEEK